MSSSRKIMGLLLICLVGVICSCGSNHQNSHSTRSYPQDGYMGLTSVNPNMPLNPSYHDQQTDIRMMHQVMAHYEEVEHFDIILKGPEAQVKIKLQAGLSGEDVARLITEVQIGLSTNMPRYRVKVTV